MYPRGYHDQDKRELVDPYGSSVSFFRTYTVRHDSLHWAWEDNAARTASLGSHLRLWLCPPRPS